MKLSFEIKDISTYRSEIMGMAILWIMMLHFTFTQIKPLGFIAQYGFAGVDIFIMVSGFGLFFSLDKDRNIKHFYKKRLLRIFPTYYIIGVIASIFLFHDSIFNYLYRYSTIGFWIGGPYWAWYVPAIVALYFTAPFLKKIIDLGEMAIIICIVISVLIISYIMIAKEIVSTREPHIFLLYRIPTFLFGMVCAFWQKKAVSTKSFYIIMLMGLPCFILLFPHHHSIYNYKYFSLAFLLPLFIIVFITFIKNCQILNPIFSTIGKASFEIYLIQGIFFHAINTGKLVLSTIWHDTITLALITVSSLLGIFTHWVIDKSGILKLF